MPLGQLHSLRQRQAISWTALILWPLRKAIGSSHSGDIFGVGVHTITASVVDAAGNSATDIFEINVVGAHQSQS